MKLYMVEFDHDRTHVEAPSFGEAVKIWQAFKKREFGWDGDEEPEQVVLVDEGGIVREPGVIMVAESMTAPEAAALLEWIEDGWNLDFSSEEILAKHPLVFAGFMKLREMGRP